MTTQNIDKIRLQRGVINAYSIIESSVDSRFNFGNDVEVVGSFNGADDMFGIIDQRINKELSSTITLHGRNVTGKAFDNTIANVSLTFIDDLNRRATNLYFSIYFESQLPRDMFIKALDSHLMSNYRDQSNSM